MFFLLFIGLYYSILFINIVGIMRKKIESKVLEKMITLLIVAFGFVAVLV